MSNTIDLTAELTNNQGFNIVGGAVNDYSGYSVSSAGDVNGDGYDDIIIGAYGADPSSKSYAGKSYIIYGSSTNPGTVDLSLSLGLLGFTILGEVIGAYSGYSVNSAGDVNDDGYDDIIIGAPYGSPNSRTNAGQSYVIYGSSTNPGTIDLAVGLTSTQGFVIFGGSTNDYSAYSVSSAGDVNGDGYSDFIIGAYGADPFNRLEAGQSYVIYGSSTNPGTIDLALELTSTQGFIITGGTANDKSGWSVSSAGDVNADGYTDIIIGASYASPNSRTNAGQSYVIYGSSTNPGTIDLALELTSTQGFTILGAFSYGNSGWSVSSAGDVNGDGYDDIIIGAPYGSPWTVVNAGISYVIYGNRNLETIDIMDPFGVKGFYIFGTYEYGYSGWSVSSARDVNRDGYEDIIVGNWGEDPSSKTDAGRSYVIYGGASNPGEIYLSAALGANGFAILGSATNDRSGYSVSSAGDLNGDGYADVITGAYWADPNSKTNAGQSYVIFGSAFTEPPTYSPSKIPTTNPTRSPTFLPTSSPTVVPTSVPSFEATYSPSSSTYIPTVTPTAQTYSPSKAPTMPNLLIPSSVPTVIEGDAVKKQTFFAVIKNSAYFIPTVTSALGGAFLFFVKIISKSFCFNALETTKTFDAKQNLFYKFCHKIYGISYAHSKQASEFINNHQQSTSPSTSDFESPTDRDTIYGASTSDFELAATRNTEYFNTKNDTPDRLLNNQHITTKWRCIILSIDANTEKTYINNQHESFIEFANKLKNFVTEELPKDIVWMLTLIESDTKSLFLEDAPKGYQALTIYKISTPTDNSQFDRSNNLMLPLLNAKQILYNLPLLHYLAQNIINYLGVVSRI